MTQIKLLESVLRAIIERSIRAAIDGGESARAERFLEQLGLELLGAAREAAPPYASLIQAQPFLWDLFIGRYGTAEDGSGAVLTRGIWAVESELEGGSKGGFNKLVAANVEHRLFVIPGGTRQVGGLQRQCNVAKVACWIAELSPLADWRAGPGFEPWVKLQFIAPRG